MSRWISVDPPLISGAYIGGDPSKLPGMGGVFNQINLNAYQYAGLNPVKYVDPDGQVIGIAIGLGITAVAVLLTTQETGDGTLAQDPSYGESELEVYGNIVANEVVGLGAAKAIGYVGKALAKKLVAKFAKDGAKQGAKFVKTDVVNRAINKFKKKLPRNATGISERTIGGKYLKIKAEVPANVGGQARKSYVKYVNQEGKTIKYFKDTFSKDGRFWQRKFTYPQKWKSKPFGEQ
jgi:hypothetical protein